MCVLMVSFFIGKFSLTKPGLRAILIVRGVGHGSVISFFCSRVREGVRMFYKILWAKNLRIVCESRSSVVTFSVRSEIWRRMYKWRQKKLSRKCAKAHRDPSV